ncbi:unnamed protein product [Rhizoctonia solani]|uniref:HNH nuclease domain-containing protein n=1 Tax=Rhizoctonia solani TaxID=456999 RepID=A0A8H2XG61_9AGAM|nr:unnamed protein product [Rhizoctonia solani]
MAPQELPVRILGQMLIQAPVIAGRAYVAGFINRCATNEEITELGVVYLGQFVNYLRAPRPPRTPRTPPMSLPTSAGPNPSLPEPTSHTEAKKQALIRDNYRCMLTGAVDNNAVKFMPELLSEVVDTRTAVRVTGCCNILPQYGGYDDMDGFNYQDTTLWPMIYSFGGVSENQLGEHGVHGLGNVLTLEYGIRSIFDGFDIWLEPTGEAENQYFIKGQEESDRRGLPERVTFSSSFPGLELPNPHYLSVHAAFARVIKLSGASRIIARIIRDLEYNTSA